MKGCADPSCTLPGPHLHSATTGDDVAERLQTICDERLRLIRSLNAVIADYQAERIWIRQQLDLKEDDSFGAVMKKFEELNGLVKQIKMEAETLLAELKELAQI